MKSIGYNPINIHREYIFFHNQLATLGNHGRAEGEKRYHKSSLKHHGVNQPTKKKLVREWIERHPEVSLQDMLDLANRLWRTNWFEEKSISILLLRQVAEQLSPDDMPQLQSMVNGSEGWVHTDEISIHILGPLSSKYPPCIIDISKWSTSPHLWTRRAAIIFQILNFRKGKGDLSTHTQIIEDNLIHIPTKSTTDEFFIHKAIGWSLREICAKNILYVEQFLIKNKDYISPIILKEASKNLPQHSLSLIDYETKEKSPQHTI